MCSLRQCFFLASLLLWAGQAVSQDFKNVAVPLIYRAEKVDLVTEACVLLREHRYLREAPIIESAAGTAESALNAVLAAMQVGQEGTLRSLSIEATGEVARRNGDNQIKAFLEQFRQLKVLGASHAYAFDDLVVFFVKLQPTAAVVKKEFHSPFVFLKRGARYLFLPDRSQALTLALLRQWFNSEVGPMSGGNGRYCREAQVAAANHRVYLGADKGPGAAALVFRGAAAGGSDKSDWLPSVSAAVERLASSAATGKLDTVLRSIASDSVPRVAAFKGTTGELDYLADWSKQRLRFGINLGQVAVAFTGGGIGIRTLFFKAEGSGWRLVNVGMNNVSTRLFDRVEMTDAALAEPPFERYRASPVLGK